MYLSGVFIWESLIPTVHFDLYFNCLGLKVYRVEWTWAVVYLHSLMRKIVKVTSLFQEVFFSSNIPNNLILSYVWKIPIPFMFQCDLSWIYKGRSSSKWKKTPCSPNQLRVNLRNAIFLNQQPNSLLFISYKFVKGFFAITFLLLLISSWNFHDVCQRFLYNQKRNFSLIRQKMRKFPKALSFVGSIWDFVSGCIKNVDTHHESFSSKKQVIKQLSPKSLWQTYMKWTVDPN